VRLRVRVRARIRGRFMVLVVQTIRVWVKLGLGLLVSNGDLFVAEVLDVKDFGSIVKINRAQEVRLRVGLKFR
jgi:hypothetical protein